MNSFRSSYGWMVIEAGEYRDGNLAIQLYRQEDGEPFATLSVNLPENAYHLRSGEFFAKTYSENMDIAQDALASGLLQDTGRRVPTPIGPVPVWNLF